MPALELLVRASLLDRREDAHAAVDELETFAREVGTAPLRAASLLARGRVEASVELLADAADLYTECGARYDAAQAQLELAGVLRAQGRAADAADAEGSRAGDARGARCACAGRDAGAVAPDRRASAR